MNNVSGESRQPLDLVFVTPSLQGGLGYVTKTLARTMQERGVRVAIWSLKETSETDTEVPTYVLNAKAASASLFELVNLLKTQKPKTVLSASFHLNIIVLLAKQLSRVQTDIFLVEHTALKQALESLTFVRRAFSRLGIWALYPKASGWLAISKTIADDIADVANINRAKISVIYNPVISPSLFEKSEEDMVEGHTGKLFVSVGRLSPEKDFPTLIRAFRIILNTIPSTLFILGEGPERKSLEALIEELDLSQNVHLLGHRDNPYPYIAHADVCITSSVREGLPTTIIEALALGTPVVSTDTPSGPREILEDGTYGILVPPQNEEALAKGIIQAVTREAPKIPSAVFHKYEASSVVDAYTKTLGI